jgi:hypothetical protein
MDTLPIAVQWEPGFAESAHAFAPLRESTRELNARAWPSCADFNRALSARQQPLVNAAGQPLKFVEQARAGAFEDKYEPRAYLRGEVQFRSGGWHDVFNALMWLTFPGAKAALNARHYRALKAQHSNGETNRTALQDALTLLDESGVIVVTCDAALGRLLATHQWKELFWVRRHKVMQHMRFYLFGHGLAAKMLQPFVGVTGRGFVCAMPADFMMLPMARQLAALDAQIAARVVDEQNPLTKHDLTPLPVLGIPGWSEDNEIESYYANTAYFRPATAKSASRR